MKMVAATTYFIYIAIPLNIKEGVSLGGTFFKDHLHRWKLIVLFSQLFYGLVMP